MKILLTNDDGIGAPGLEALGERLVLAGHEVHCLAPDRCNSACAHAITLRKGLRLERLDYALFTSCRVLDGTPADCVMLGLNHVFQPREIDLVLSGINNGLNVAEDIHYSGTVAGAREACIHGVPAMALSIEENSEDRLGEFAAEIARLLDFVPLLGKNRGGRYLNINHPGRPGRLGIRLTRPGTRRYLNFIEPLDEKERVEIVSIGGVKDISGNPEGTDCHAIEAGEISLTPLGLNCYDGMDARDISDALKQLNGA